MKWSEWLHPISAAVVGGMLLAGLILMVTNKPLPATHINPCTAHSWECYSIQGVYSKQDCPGQYKEFMEVDGTTFFLGCMLGSPK